MRGGGAGGKAPSLGCFYTFIAASERVGLSYVGWLG